MDTKIKRISGLTTVPHLPGGQPHFRPICKTQRILSSLWPPVTDSKWSNRYSAFYAKAEEKSGEALAHFCL